LRTIGLLSFLSTSKGSEEEEDKQNEPDFFYSTVREGPPLPHTHTH
jgi:hypothetical protein